MVYTNFIRIKDISATSAIWGGEDVLLLATDFSINSGNVLSNSEKTFQDTSITTADTTDTATDMRNNYNRRKGNVSYGGFSNSNIKVSCVYDDDKVGNIATIEGVSSKIFTPSKLYELILKPRTIYLRDEFLVELLQSAQDSSPIVYGSNGIPVILLDWSIIPSLEGKHVTMELNFREDKGSVA